MAEKCTNTSFDPSSGVMNPKPLVPLNHFTTPSAIANNLRFSRTCSLDCGDRSGVSKRRRSTWNPIAATTVTEVLVNRLRYAFRRLHGRLGRRAEVQQATAERDRAQR